MRDIHVVLGWLTAQAAIYRWTHLSAIYIHISSHMSGQKKRFKRPHRHDSPTREKAHEGTSLQASNQSS
jgi:hypothetical protein